MLGPLRGLVIAVAFALPSAAAAQLQVNQNFLTQGPAPSFGPTGTVQSADAPPNGNVVGAIGPVIADPLNANRFFIGTPAGGIWRTSDGGATWTPLTDQQASLSIASLARDLRVILRRIGGPAKDGRAVSQPRWWDDVQSRIGDRGIAARAGQLADRRPKCQHRGLCEQ